MSNLPDITTTRQIESQSALWRRYVSVAGAIILLILLVRSAAPDNETVSTVAGALELLLIICHTVCVFVGVKRYRPKHRSLWLVCTLTPMLLVAAVVSQQFEPNTPGTDTYDNLSDYLFMIGLLPVLWFMIGVNRARSSGGDVAGLIDSSMIAGAFALITWTFTVAPRLHGVELSTQAKITQFSLPVTELLLTWMVVRIGFGSARRTTPYWGLLVGGLSITVTDILYTWFLLNHDISPLIYGFANSAWDVAYLAFFSVALHPDMVTITDKPRVAPSIGSRNRLVMTSIAALTAPLLILVRGSFGNTDGVVLALGAMIMFVLVVLRLEGMLRRQEETSRRLDESLRRIQEADLQLRQAQKMEAVGKLAAGVAHEINTPIQAISSNVQFMGRSFDEMANLHTESHAVVAERASELVEQLQRLEDEIDLELLTDEVPRAVVDSLDGLQKMASIVAAMREFGATDQESTKKVDINDALRNVLALASSRLSPFADIATDLNEVPLINGYARAIHDALLQILINAAQAVEKVAANATNGAKGTITLRTWADESNVCVSIADTGEGIPVEIRDRIFEPFFTTRAVGSGTGQGLAVVWNVFVERHGATIEVESTQGHGTVFTIKLPVAG